MGKKARLRKLRKRDDAGIAPQSPARPFRLSDRAQNAIALVLCAIALILGILLRLNNLDVRGRSPDEGVYTYQAKVTSQSGAEGTRRLIAEHGLSMESWIYPPPIRIGYTYLLAGVMNASKIYDERAGSYLSAACSIGCLFILSLIGIRFLNSWITFVALLLMSVSPMDLAIARRSWQDGVLALVGVFLIYCCSEMTAGSRRALWYVPFWLAGSYCILIKESGIIVYGLCVVWLAVVTVLRERSIVKTALLMIGTIAGVGLSLLILARTVGGLDRVIEVLRHVKDAMPTNTYAIDYQTGPWYRIFEGLWILTPAVFLFSAIGAALSLAGGRISRYIDTGNPASVVIAKGLVFIVASFIFITIVTPYMQNIRYLSVTFVPMYLLCGIGVWSILSFVRALSKGPLRYVAIIVAALALIAVSVTDYRTFEKIFVKRGIRDISIRLVRESVGGYAR